MIFVPEGKQPSRPLHYGVWRFLGGTGSLADLKGAGTLRIRLVEPKVREFTLEGEAVLNRP